MSPQEWGRVKDVFCAALTRSPAERAEFLDRACPADLRGEVASLLAHYSSGFLSPLAGPLLTLPPLGRLGRYRLLAPIGAGGMAVVYRAHDPRLGRDVALKILPARPDRTLRRRFEREAAALARARHPGVVAVHDAELDHEPPFLVMELLEGESLRSALARGDLSEPRKLAVAGAVAEALGHCHRLGIVHRDVKPENIFLCRDGSVKLLDLGLARLVDEREQLTRSGLLGTPGYVSPEQVRGSEADARSDVFALGIVLYELVCGRHPFSGPNALAVLQAILHEAPAPPELAPALAPLAPVIERALCADPAERWQDAVEMGRALAAAVSAPDATFAPAGGQLREPSITALAAGALAALVASVGLQAFDDPPSSPPPAVAQRASLPWPGPPPSGQRLDHRQGTVWGGRFDPRDGAILYSASWEGGPRRLYRLAPDDEAPLPQPAAEGALIAAVSASGQPLLLYDVRLLSGGRLAGRLETGPADLLGVDLDPAGGLAVVRRSDDGSCLEWPPGRRLYPPGSWALWLSNPRVAPDGQRVAVLEGDALLDGRARVLVLDRRGRPLIRSESWPDASGLAWAPGAGEVWFSAAPSGHESELLALDLRSGRVRTLWRTAGAVRLLDVDRAGRSLVTVDRHASTVWLWSASGAPAQRVSAGDFADLTGLGADGETVLYVESGTSVAGAPTAFAWSRRTNRAAVLGPGIAWSPTADGRAVMIDSGWTRLVEVKLATGVRTPLLVGPPRCDRLPANLAGLAFARFDWASFLPDGRRVIVAARQVGRPGRNWLHDPATGTTCPVTPEGVGGATLDAEGTHLLASDATGARAFYPLSGAGTVRPAPAIDPGCALVGWEGDLPLILAADTIPAAIYAVAGAHRLERFRLELADRSGILGLYPCLVTPDQAYVACAEERVLSDLRLLDVASE